jgi:hypothetical protein
VSASTVLVTQPGAMPSRKVQSVILSGSVSTSVATIVTWLLETYTKVDIPGPVEVALAALVTAAIAYLTNEDAQVVNQ